MGLSCHDSTQVFRQANLDRRLSEQADSMVSLKLPSGRVMLNDTDSSHTQRCLENRFDEPACEEPEGSFITADPTAAKLDWSLVISTINRREVLAITLKCALTQTRLPSEVIVTDASESWEADRDWIEQQVAPYRFEGLRWVYQPAEVRSLTAQRNQGIAESRCPILFLIDDDSWMYPDCAERILETYEDPANRRVVAIQCVHRGTPPDEIASSDANAEESAGSLKQKRSWYRENAGFDKTLRSWGVTRFLRHQLLLQSTGIDLIPYYGGFPVYSEETRFTGSALRPVRFMSGYGMTFRRDVLEKEKFESAMHYYAAGEDMEISYRVRQHGMILLHREARLHHYQSASGRLSRFTVSQMAVLNRMLWVKLRSTNHLRDYTKMAILTARILLAEFLKEGFAARWTFPRLRGTLAAVPKMVKMASLPTSQVRPWYIGLQRKLVERK